MVAAPDPRDLLDHISTRLVAGEPPDAPFEALIGGLRGLQASLGPIAWSRAVAVVQAHPLLTLLRESPLDRRAATKPRGYVGDAMMLDMLLLGESVLAEDRTSTFGLALFRAEAARPFAAALRERVACMAAQIDRAAAVRPAPHVLALGCGHLREAAQSAAVREGRVGRLLGLDQDGASLAVVQLEQGARGVETLQRGARATVDGTLAPASFDLVTAATHFDDIPDRLAETILAGCFALLRPGGRLIIANGARGMADASWLEACLDWPLYLRDAAGLHRLAQAVPAAEVGCRRVFTLENESVFYLELQRKGRAA